MGRNWTDHWTCLSTVRQHVQRELMTTLRVRLALDSNTSALQFLLSDSTAMVGASRNVQVMVSLQGGIGANDAFRAWSAKYEPDLGLFVEMVDRFVVPFDRRVVELAHQRHHSELCSKETAWAEVRLVSGRLILDTGQVPVHHIPNWRCNTAVGSVYVLS